MSLPTYVNPAQPCVESHAPKQVPKPPLYTCKVRNDVPELSVAHLIRYDWPEESLKTESQAGLEPGKAEALAEIIELLTVPLGPLLVPDRVALTEGDELGKPVELSDVVEDVDVRLMDTEGDAEEEVIDPVIEAEAVEVLLVIVEDDMSPSSVSLSSSPIDVEVGISTSLKVMLGISASADIFVRLRDDVLLEDGVFAVVEMMLVLLRPFTIVELVVADEEAIEDDFVVVVLMISPVEEALPGTRLR
jgi:hypothetical protein